MNGHMVNGCREWLFLCICYFLVEKDLRDGWESTLTDQCRNNTEELPEHALV